VNLDDIPFYESVIGVDHLPLEGGRPPDARMLHRGREVLVDSGGEVAHGRAVGQRERRRTVGGLSRLLRVDAQNAQCGEGPARELVEPACRHHGNRRERPAMIEQLVDDRDVLLAAFTIDPRW
jgi:hypothetical protein